MTVALRICRLQDLDESDIGAWAELGLHSTCPNVFAMPQFVRPAARWLTPDAPVLVVLIERTGRAGRQLIGAGCFTLEQAGWGVPVAHLRGYASQHSFRSGLLVAPGAATEVAVGLLRARVAGMRWQGIAFRNIEVDGDDFRALLGQVEEQRGSWVESRRFQRPLLRVEAEGVPEERVGASVRKDLRRRWRKLQGHGPVEVRVERDPSCLDAAASHHLRLEHAGWKGEGGSSMLSSPAQEAFFREMVAGFGAVGAAAFVELRVGDEVVASTSNVVVGGVISAFKTGWDPRFAQSSPGRLAEFALFQRMSAEWPGLRVFDSNAREDSYLAGMVPDRAVMATGVFAQGPVTAGWLRLARSWRPVARRFGDEL